MCETHSKVCRNICQSVENHELNSLQCQFEQQAYKGLYWYFPIIIPFYNNTKDKISDHLWEEREYSTEFIRDAEPMELFPKIFSPANPDLGKKRTITTLASPVLADSFQEADVVRNLTFASCLSDVPEFLSYSNPRVNNIQPAKVYPANQLTIEEEKISFKILLIDLRIKLT